MLMYVYMVGKGFGTQGRVVGSLRFWWSLRSAFAPMGFKTGLRFVDPILL